MQRIIHCYRLLNILSLDVAAGATISALFLAKTFEVSVKFQGFLCLGLTVWLIYTADHLVDAKSVKREASTSRHRFHQRYFNLIVIMALVILASIVPLLFFIYKPVFVWGLGLAAVVVVYFVLQKKLGFLKEVLGALLYSVGVMLPVIALSEMPIWSIVSIPAILFFNTALINLILFSWFDRDKDIVDKHASLVTIFGSKVAEGFLYLIFLLQGILIINNVHIVEHNTLIIFILMNLVLLIIFLKAQWFSINDRYRLMGDAVFLLPIIYLFLKW